MNGPAGIPPCGQPLCRPVRRSGVERHGGGLGLSRDQGACPDGYCAAMTNPPSLTAEELQQLLGPEAASWPELGLTITRGALRAGSADDQVKVWRGGELVGFTEESDRFPGMRVYRAVVTTDGEGLPYGVAFPAGFIPPDPLRAQAGERRRWLPEGHPDRPAVDA